MARRLMSNSDLFLFVVLIAGSWWIIRYPIHGFDPGASAPLAGALVGGAALLLGNWINRYNDSKAAAVELQKRASEVESRTKRLETLLAAELVNVAASLIDAKKFVDAALISLKAGGTVEARQDMSWLMPPRPFNDDLELELLILEQPAIDALVTLRSNLFKTRRAMAGITDGRDNFGWLRATALSGALAQDMTVLSKVFEYIAPTREFVVDDKPPELAISILKRIAAKPLT